MPSAWQKTLHKKELRDHRNRVKNACAFIDNKMPRELPPSNKKEIEKRIKFEKIEKGNRLLLDRLGKAMLKSNIDNKSTAPLGTSLMGTHRKVELAKISLNNRRLLERIQLTDPVYDVTAWEREAEERDIYLRNMTEFPELFVPRYGKSQKVARIEQRAKVLLATPHTDESQELMGRVRGELGSSRGLRTGYFSTDDMAARPFSSPPGSPKGMSRPISSTNLMNNFY